MSDSDLLDDFLAVSAALTGFSVAQLQGTGWRRRTSTSWSRSWATG